MINAQKPAKSPLIKLFLHKKMLRYKNILHSSKEQEMVLIETFLNLIQNLIHGDIHVSRH